MLSHKRESRQVAVKEKEQHQVDFYTQPLFHLGTRQIKGSKNTDVRAGSTPMVSLMDVI